MGNCCTSGQTTRGDDKLPGNLISQEQSEQRGNGDTNDKHKVSNDTAAV